MPLDQFKREQARIDNETAYAQEQISLAGTKLDAAKTVIQRALVIAQNFYKIYKSSPNGNGRKLNHNVFKAVYVKGGKVSRHEYEEPFAGLMTKGSNKDLLVDLAGVYSNRQLGQKLRSLLEKSRNESDPG